MAYVREYWDNKENRAKLAKKHCADMAFHFARMISDSVTETELYFPDFKMDAVEVPADHRTEFIVADLDSVSAIFEYDAGKTAVLNFSSYKNPGGMFLNGSKAQEECLCHASTLYNVLKSFQVGFYDWNNQHKNKALYLNRGLYSPNIAFIHNEKRKACDVITCAAPNKSAAQRYQNVTDEENTAYLLDRIRFVLDIAAANKVNTLILGAYGCGVFGQDATEVAEVFKHYLTTTHKMFDTVVFAVPSGRDGNLQKFQAVFNAEQEVKTTMRTEDIKVTFGMKIPYDKPDLNGVTYSKEAIEKAVADIQSGIPIVFRGDVSQEDICLGVTTGEKEVKFDDENHVCELTMAGIIHFGGTDCMVESDGVVVSSMRIMSFGLSV